MAYMVTKQTTTDTVHLSQNETMTTTTMMMMTATPTKTTVTATTKKKNYTKDSHSFLSYNHLCRNSELLHNFSYILK